MTMTSTSYDGNRLADLERDLSESDLTSKNLGAFFDTAMAQGERDRVLAVLSRLRVIHPNHIQLTSLYISACLQVQDDQGAMAAIEELLSFTKPDPALVNAGLAVRDRMGAMRIDRDCRYSISLCMIMRNEADHLSRCLHQVKPLVDEMILVDTGSSDNTKDLGRLYGAQVLDFPWCQNFATARNVSLASASGDWILILDVDETIARQDFEAMRSMIRFTKDQSRAFSIETRNYSHLANAVGWQPNRGSYQNLEAGMGWFPSKKVRLFPNHPQIRFHFPVHERVEPALRKLGVSIAPCPVPVHHYGHLNEDCNRQKALAYYRLGYAKLNQMGDDLPALRELAVQAGQLERWSEAVSLWQRLVGLKPDFGEALINLSGAYWQMAQYDDSLLWAQKAIDLDAGIKEAHYNLALSLFMRGKINKAHKIMAELIKDHPDYLSARFMSAVVLGCLGDFPAADAMLTALQKTMPPKVLALALEDMMVRLKAAGQLTFHENLNDFYAQFTRQST